MASIDEFVAAFASGGVSLAAANRFSIDGPGTPDYNKWTNLPLNKLIRDATIAGKSIGTYSWRNTGTPFRLPYDVIYGDLTLTFIDTEMYDIRRFYNEWMRDVYDDNDTQVGYGYYSDYVRDITVYQHAKSIEEPTYGVTYINCYPIGVSDITMSNDSTNTLTTFSVTLAFERWEEKVARPKISKGVI